MQSISANRFGSYQHISGARPDLPISQIRFGDLTSGSGQAFASGIEVLAKKPEDENAKSKYKGKLWLAGVANVLLAPAMAFGLMNPDYVAAQLRQHENKQSGQPLTSVLDQSPKAQPSMPVKEVLRRVQSSSMMNPSLLQDAVKSGLVKEILVVPQDAVNAKVVLIDGSERNARLAAGTLDEINQPPINVPIRTPSMSGFKLDAMTSVIVSLFVTNLLVGGALALTVSRKQKIRAHKEQTRRQQADEMARFLVALKLPVTEEQIPALREQLLLEDVKNQFKEVYSQGERPMTVDEILKRSPVLLAPSVAEKILFNDTVSLPAAKMRETVSQIVRLLYQRSGMLDPVNGYVPEELNEEQKTTLEGQVKTHVLEALRQAEEILGGYDPAGLENLMKTLKRHPKPTPEQTERLLNNESWADVSNSLFYKAFRAGQSPFRRDNSSTEE